MAKRLNLIPELSITSKGIRRKNPDYVWCAVDAMGAILSLAGRGNFTDRYIEGAGIDSPWVSVMTRLEGSLRFYKDEITEFPYYITTEGYDPESWAAMRFKVATNREHPNALKYTYKDYWHFEAIITERTPDIGIAHFLLKAVEKGREIFRNPHTMT